MTVNLSVVLIVKNEAHHIQACLESARRLGGEIVIVDAGSIDDTLKMAEPFTNKIYIHDQWQGYGKQRQIAQSYASKDWILMLDADERITPELAQEIKQAVQQNDQNMVYSLARLSHVFGRFIRRGGWYPDRILRLYPKSKAQYTDALVHEKLAVSAGMKIVKLRGDLLHYTYRDLEHYLTKSAQYSTAWAQQRKEKGKHTSIGQGFAHGVFCFIKMYILRLGFLDGRQGLLLALLSAHSVFAKYANLWVMHQDDQNT